MGARIHLGFLLCLAMTIISTTVTVTALEYGETCQLTPSPAPTPTSTPTQAPAPAPAGTNGTPTVAPAPAPANPNNGNATERQAAVDPCNAEAWLKCDGAKCVCQPGMVLAKDRKTCISTIGQPCQTSESDPTHPVRSCIENAFCATPDDVNKSAMCQCEQGYLPIPGNGACRKGPGAACDRTDDCNTNALLSCQNGQCLCDRQGSQIWDPVQIKCLSVVGGPCNERDEAFIKRPCVQNAVCNNRTMQCECKNATFKESPDKRCLLNYDQPCEASNANAGGADTKCHPYYECIATPTNTNITKCGCNSTTSVFDEKFQICAILAGKSCGSGSSASGMSGNRNAFCVERANCSERYKQCKCDQDFIQTSAGFCTGGYRAACDLDSDKCDEELNLRCNEENRECECKPTYVYNENSRKCVGFIGTNCTMDSDCYALAECSTGGDKKCRCKPGWSATPNNTCLVAYGKSCTSPDQCNSYDFLKCEDISLNKVCQCENPVTMVYNSATGKCVSRAGSHCSTAAVDGSKQRKLGCVENATCAEIATSGDKTVGVCNCSEGFNNVDGNCEKIASSSASVQQPWTMTLTAVVVVVTIFWQNF